MISPIRVAVLAIAAAIAVALTARADAPSVVARIEIRGLDAFFGAIDRISAPYAPAGQAKGMFTGMGSASVGVNPFELIDGAGTVRVVVYGVDDDMDVLLDFPAAGGDVAGVIGKLERALHAAELPEGVVLPEGALSLGNGSFASTICIPCGERIALVPHTAFSHEIRDVDGALALLDSAPAVAADGVWAIAVDFDAVRTCVSSARAGSSGAQLRDYLSMPGFPLRSFAVGLGLDDADRFRVDLSVALVPGTPYARLAETIGAPASPLASAILFPDAVAAASVHQATSIFTDDELRDFFVRQFDRNFFAATLAVGGNGKAIPAEVRDAHVRDAHVRDALVSAYIPLFHMLGDEYAFAVLPAEEGDGAGSVGLLAFPENPQEALDSLADSFDEMVGGLAWAMLTATEADGDGTEIDWPLVRIEQRSSYLARSCRLPTDEHPKETRSLTVNGYVVGIEDPSTDDNARVLGSFEAAAVGPALYIGTLPEARRDEVLHELDAGTSAKGPVAAMPAFAEAYGEAPADASCGFVRLCPLFRILLSRMETFARTVGDHDCHNVSNALAAFDALPALPELTVATTQRWIPDGNRLETVVSMPLTDLHSVARAILALQSRTCTGAFSDPAGAAYVEEDEEGSGEAPSED